MIGRRSSPAVARSADTDNPYWISFSDIMAGLLIIFILSLIYLMIQLLEEIRLNRDTRDQVQEALRELSRIDQIRKELLHEIKTELAEQNIVVEVVEDNTVLRIPVSQLHFKSGSDQIPDDRKYVVDEIGAKILMAIQKGNRLKFIDTIFVEGHTDSDPMEWEIGNWKMDNWGLSTHRAISIWKYWTKQPGELVQMSELVNRKGDATFSVSGYADTRRVQESENDDDDKRKNRRIDIRFTMYTPEGVDLQQLIRKLEDVEHNASTPHP